jgi:hypothetical protein
VSQSAKQDGPQRRQRPDLLDVIPKAIPELSASRGDDVGFAIGDNDDIAAVGVLQDGFATGRAAKEISDPGFGPARAKADHKPFAKFP